MSDSLHHSWLVGMHAKHSLSPNEIFFYFIHSLTLECCDAAIATVGGGFSKQNPVLGGAVRATPGPPKTPFLGLPKSRPSPLQKCAKNGVFGRKSVHFRSICAQFCTKMTSFLRT